jgi:hypothetical protein
MPTDAEIRPARHVTHPDDPEISAGGTLASGRGRRRRLGASPRGRQGNPGPRRRSRGARPLRVEETAKAAALLGFTGHFHLGYHDGELPDDQRAARPSPGTSGSCDLRWCSARTPRRCSSATGTTTTATTAPGWATLDAVFRRRQPALFRRPPRRGARLASRAGRVPLGHAEPNTVDISDTLERRSTRSSPRKPADRDGRVVPAVPARSPKRPGAAGVATPRASAASASAAELPGASRRHSAIARNTSTATMPTPTAGERPTTSPATTATRSRPSNRDRRGRTR